MWQPAAFLANCGTCRALCLVAGVAVIDHRPSRLRLRLSIEIHVQKLADYDFSWTVQYERQRSVLLTESTSSPVSVLKSACMSATIASSPE